MLWKENSSLFTAATYRLIGQLALQSIQLERQVKDDGTDNQTSFAPSFWPFVETRRGWGRQWHVRLLQSTVVYMINYCTMVLDTYEFLQVVDAQACRSCVALPSAEK